MYNIYINERLLKIVPEQDSLTGVELVFRLKGEESVNFISDLVASFETQTAVQSMLLVSHNVDKTWNTFKQHYKLIDAAGGVVMNDENKLLMIYRLNRWDLPKGKMEKNETPDEAALREVEEECGLHHLTLNKQLSNTYHTYQLNGKQLLKRTFWFMMTTDEKVLIPQTEENITEVRWMNKEEVKAASKHTYPGIEALLMKHHLI